MESLYTMPVRRYHSFMVKTFKRLINKRSINEWMHFTWPSSGRKVRLGEFIVVILKSGSLGTLLGDRNCSMSLSVLRRSFSARSLANSRPVASLASSTSTLARCISRFISLNAVWYQHNILHSAAMLRKYVSKMTLKHLVMHVWNLNAKKITLGTCDQSSTIKWLLRKRTIYRLSNSNSNYNVFANAPYFDGLTHRVRGVDSLPWWYISYRRTWIVIMPMGGPISCKFASEALPDGHVINYISISFHDTVPSIFLVYRLLTSLL